VSDQVTPEALVVETPSADGPTERSEADRAADHAAIADSIEELVPALIAKLGAIGLAELEVREDAVRVRVRRPADGVVAHDGRGDRGARGDRSRGSAAHAPTGRAGGDHRDVRAGGDARDGHDRRAGGDGYEAPSDPPPAIATSPAVGIYHPRPGTHPGTRVRAGDRIGVVDMLGVPQEVVAPTDGLVGASLVEPGDAVEYGQDLVMIESASAGSAAAAASGSSAPARPLAPPKTPPAPPQTPPTPPDH
jgi:biotin carboxyl carrier protein